MSRANTLMTLILLLFLWSCQCDDNKDDNLMILWCNKPAQVWEETLLLGNGRMGTMVFGNPANEHFQINEETVWAGEPGNNLLKGFKEVLPKL